MVKWLLEYILSSRNNRGWKNTLSTISSVPLILKEDMTLTKLQNNKIILSTRVNLFPGFKERFLHNDLIDLIQAEKNWLDYFQEITIADLADFLPNLFNTGNYCDIFGPAEFIMSNSNHYNEIWKIISSAIGESAEIGENFRALLDPIKNWRLIPVLNNRLEPISMAGSILTPDIDFEILAFFQSIGFSIFDHSRYSKTYSKLKGLESAVVSLSNNQELLTFLDNHKFKLNEAFNNPVNDYDRRRLLVYLNKQVYRNEQQQTVELIGYENADQVLCLKAKRILKELPIYQDILSKLIAPLAEHYLSKKKALFIDTSKVPWQIKSKVFETINFVAEIDQWSDFMEFNNDKNQIIIELGKLSVSFNFLSEIYTGLFFLFE